MKRGWALAPHTDLCGPEDGATMLSQDQRSVWGKETQTHPSKAESEEMKAKYAERGGHSMGV